MGKRVRLEEPVATKKVAAKSISKEIKVKLPDIDPDFLHKLCAEMYVERLNADDGYRRRGGLLPIERMRADYVKKYGSVERAEKRIAEQAQIYAPVVRVALQIMARRGILPKEAKG